MTMHDRLVWLGIAVIAAMVLGVVCGLVTAMVTKNAAAGLATGGAVTGLSVPVILGSVSFLYGRN
jgi:ABC-type dipeptide/oligopeptide/nickel transport system permease component